MREGLGMLGNPLVLILLVAAIVSGLLGEMVDAALIIVIVPLSVALDFFQVYRSEQAANQLKSTVASTANVWRDHHLVKVAVRDVVPGDVLELHAGDLLSADGTLLSRDPVSVDEAALTGESLPVEGAAERRTRRRPNYLRGPRSSAALAECWSPRRVRERSLARSHTRSQKRRRSPSSNAASGVSR